MDLTYHLIQSQAVRDANVRVQEAGAKSFLNKFRKRFGVSSPSETELSDFLVGIGMATSTDQAIAMVQETHGLGAKYGDFLLWEKRLQLIREPGSEGSEDHYRLRTWYNPRSEN